MTTRGDIARRIREFILQRFPAARYKDFSDADSLLDGGIIDSMGVLEIVGFVETTFGVTVLDEDLNPQNFQSVDSLSAYLESKKRDEIRS